MAGTSPALVVRVSANISALQTDLAAAAATVKSTTDKIDALAAGMSSAGRAAATSAVPVTNLHGAFQQFDSVLASLGIHIGPEIKALGELGAASGKSAGAIGLLGTAGLVAGAAIGGWKIGRLVADFFDLDNAIGSATAKLMGWGDLAGEVAGAKQDTINAAIDRGARATISYGEAIKFNTIWLKEHNKETDAAKKAHDEWAKAMVELNAAGQGWQGTLEGIDGETVSAVEWYLKAGVSQNALATAYHLTDVQVKAIASSVAAATEAEKKEQQAVDDLVAAYEKLHVLTITNDRKNQAETAKLLAEQTAIVNAGVIEAFTLQTAYNKSVGLDASGAVAMQVTALDVLTARLAEIAAMHTTAAAKVTLTTLANKDFEASTLADAKAIDAEFAALRNSNDELAKVPALKAAAFALTGEGIPAVGDTVGPNGRLMRKDWGGNIGVPAIGAPIYARAGGGPVTAGHSYLVGERGPELYTPGASGVITPNGGGGTTVIQLVVDGRVLAQVVSDHQTKSMMQSRQWPA